MRYIDLTVQTLLILLIPALSGIGQDELLLSVLTSQMFLGPWQLLSSIIGVVSKDTAYRYKRIHLAYSGLYFLVMLVGGLIVSAADLKLNYVFMMSYLIIPPWVLAAYYYRITWLTVFPGHRNHSKFLPHINF